MIRCCKYLVVFLMIHQSTGIAQTNHARFNNLTTKDGLPQNMVDCMLQDRNGFMWFGTWNGLCRYDGYDFEVFNNNDQEKFNLRSNFIHALWQDQFGNIWIGTGDGLFIYLYDEHVFKKADSTSSTQETSQTIQIIKSIDEQHVVIGSKTNVRIIEILDHKGNFHIKQQINLADSKQIAVGTLINTLSVDTLGMIWVGTNDGLLKFDEQLKWLKTYRHDQSVTTTLTSSIILEIFESQSGILWIGTENGLNKFYHQSEQFERFYSEPTNENSLAHNTVMNILEDNQQQLLIGTLGGFSILNLATSKFTNYVYQPNKSNSLSNDFINCLLIDNRENIWIGTERGGVNIYNSQQNTFDHFEYEINNPNSLSQSTINSIYEDSKFIWIGTAGGGLDQYDKKKKKFKHFRNKLNDIHSLSSDFVTAIKRTSKGELWVATWGQGINVLTNEGLPNESFLRHSELNSGMVSNFISCIQEDIAGNIWIGSLGGLMKFDKKKRTFKTVYNSDNKELIVGVGCLNLDEKGILWVGTQTGLFRLTILENESYQLVKFTHNPDILNTISGNYVISLHAEPNGTMWVGTYGHGINAITQDGDQFAIKHYNSSDGLSNNIVYAIEEDNTGHLWLSTDYGLTKFDPKTALTRNYYETDGLLNNQYYWSASFKNEDGKLFFGGMKGLDAFYPNALSEEIVQPTVTITDIKLANESVIPGMVYNGIIATKENVSKAKALDLSYMDKIFSFEFSTLNFQTTEIITYAYFLEGFDKEWNYIKSPRHFVSYTNLKPGDYKFKVKAAGSNGEFGTEPTTVFIHIEPPFWQTMWFNIVLVLTLVSIVVGYIRFRVYSLKKQKALLEKQVVRRTEEISQQKEALSYQAVQLQKSNLELEQKQQMIEGQNRKLEDQNKEIVSQRDEVIELNNKVNLVSQLKLSFFTNISHEFRTPLTLILGPLERLLANQSLTGDVKNSLEVMNRNAKRLLHLINEIIEFRKIEKGKVELKVASGDITEFCKTIFEAFEPLAEIKQISFSYVHESVPKEVFYDAHKIENILYNLLSNAFKYTPNGGEVRFELSGISSNESKLKLNAPSIQQNMPLISIKIIDSGTGISEENLPLIFKRFFRIESENAFKIGGSGIGLALTEELIKTHHGEIFVSSQPGEGSVFEIQFPCLRGDYAIDEQNQPIYESSNLYSQVEILKNELLVHEDQTTDYKHMVLDKEKRTILVVEDNADLRKFISLRLCESYNILEASDGEKGIALAQEFDPDLIVSDVMMPKVDGFELCATIKNNFSTCHIPVILLTAKSSVENQIEGLQIGADDYLPKPFNFDFLEARISNLIDTRQRLKDRYLHEEDFQIKGLSINGKDQKFLEEAKRVVQEQMLNADFGSKDLVVMLGVSRSLLHKKLIALTNQSATEFINHLRMKEAKLLLKVGDKNISEVAYTVGYNDPKYFTRLFSKYFGESPKEYQEKVLN